MKPAYWIMILLLIGAGAFYGGVRYQMMQRLSFENGIAMKWNGNPGGSGKTMNLNANIGGARPLMGEIISQDDTSITVKLQDGSSKIVLVPESTVVNKAAQGSKSDLKTGERVMVIGTNNSDGSVTASNLQLNVANGGIMDNNTPRF